MCLDVVTKLERFTAIASRENLVSCVIVKFWFGFRKCVHVAIFCSYKYDDLQECGSEDTFVFRWCFQIWGHVSKQSRLGVWFSSFLDKVRNQCGDTFMSDIYYFLADNSRFCWKNVHCNWSKRIPIGYFSGQSCTAKFDVEHLSRDVAWCGQLVDSSGCLIQNRTCLLLPDNNDDEVTNKHI